MPGDNCQNTNLEVDKEYFILAELKSDVYKPVMGEIEATRENITQVTRACGLTSDYPPDLHPMDSEKKCPIPVSQAECIKLPESNDSEDDPAGTIVTAVAMGHLGHRWCEIIK